MEKPMDFLKVHQGRITQRGRPVHLKGVNLGGWLMPEAYFLHAPNRGHRYFRDGFIKARGEKAYQEIEKAFRANFIVEDDFRRIAACGFDHVRLPFHYELIETAPYVYSKDGLQYLVQAVAWGKRHGLRLILDMHAVPGAQNHDWHADSDGRVLFYSSKVYQQRAAALWQVIAARFKDEPAVIGYDILNETVIKDPAPMNAYYHAAIKAIRAVDTKHILFVEGNTWAQDIACLDVFDDDKLVLGIHSYKPQDFTFNLVPGLKYPLAGEGRAVIRKRMEGLAAIARKRGRALWCGEFGTNARGGLYGDDVWVKDITAAFQACEIHWSYWTWKAVKHFMYPDGIFSYYPNDPWVNRMGPVFGWDTWASLWPEHRKAMAASWRTDKFTLNKEICQALKSAL
ncbi:MAG: glycoside hydrolase family 5 protein [Candidatus Omnitrophica bacterium]|nr:glycoside hydrolase family 5 protein [Candidatus Omnitrophota bacterium]